MLIGCHGHVDPGPVLSELLLGVGAQASTKEVQAQRDLPDGLRVGARPGREQKYC